jgi:isopentenyl diphosphate isomerase/L-lactate dehydrogenase-like FMN-dependent dehydrogenase
MPKSVYMALVAGADGGITLADNVAAFGELRLRPVTAVQPATRDMSTTVMTQPISMPVLISPTGVQAVHPDGEVAVARAAATRGVAMGLSSFASKPIVPLRSERSTSTAASDNARTTEKTDG